LEEDPAGSDVFVTSFRHISSVRVREGSGCDQYTAEHGLHPFVLVKKFGFPLAKVVVEINSPEQ
jgi:hypothetical protein